MSQIKLKDLKGSKILAENPWLESIQEIEDIVKEHGKVKGDKIVKATFLAYDSGSPYRKTGMTMARILKDILYNVMRNSGIKWTDDYMKEFVEFWTREMCTPSERALNTLKRELDRFDEFFEKDTKISMDTAKDRIAVAKEYKNLVESFLELQKKVEKELRAGETKKNKTGGYQRSLVEKMAKK